MAIKMPAEIRTGLRTLLRDHPNVTDYVKKKSDVNNLTRDSLVELADNLGIDFIKELQANKDIDFVSVWRFEEHMSPSIGMLGSSKGEYAFYGELTSDFELRAFGAEQTLKIKFKYGFTPEWQFACLIDKRLKYRRAGNMLDYSVEVFDEDEQQTKWIGYKDGLDLWPLLYGAIDDELYEQIEKRSQKEDKKNRKTLGFPALKKYE